MSEAFGEIQSLLFRYAEAVDSGDFVTAAGLFSRARVVFSGFGTESFGGEMLLKSFQDTVRVYEDGTPRTKHLVTNPIIEIDAEAGTAKCRSYYTVLLGVPGENIQIVCAGRYFDEFAITDGEWHFTYRDYLMPDLLGDMRGHLAAA